VIEGVGGDGLLTGVGGRTGGELGIQTRKGCLREAVRERSPFPRSEPKRNPKCLRPLKPPPPSPTGFRTRAAI
jgi:hypothetical protein